MLGWHEAVEGAGIAAVWDQGQLIRDPYSGATTGEVQLTLNYLYQLAFPKDCQLQAPEVRHLSHAEYSFKRACRKWQER